MDNKWSIWSKRITSYILILVGIYMGLVSFKDSPIKYELVYVILFLGSGLINIGMSIYYKLKNGKNE